MPDDTTGRDYIGECARHQNREGVSINVYEGLSDEDRIALARMTTDARPSGETRGWIATHPLTNSDCYAHHHVPATA